MKRITWIVLVCVCFMYGCKQKSDTADSRIVKNGFSTIVADSVEYEPEETGDEVFGPYLIASEFPDTPFIREMVETYNVCVLYNGLRSVSDVEERYETPEFALASLDAANVNVLTNESLKSLSKEVIDAYKQYYTVEVEVDSTNDVSGLDSLAYQKVMACSQKLEAAIAERSDIKKFGTFSEPDYWKLFDYSDQFKDIMRLINNPVNKKNISTSEVQQNIKMLKERIEEEKDFDSKCSLVQAYIDYVGLSNIDFSIIDGVLNDGRYAHRLYFLWRTWRCGIQLLHPRFGSSPWAAIPNKLYNEKRIAIARTSLKHLAQHPDDIIAINQFLCLANLENILRIAANPLGNEAVSEMVYLRLRSGLGE